jgi:hypothetical protein
MYSSCLQKAVKYYLSQKSWIEAKLACQKMGMGLVSMETKEENICVKKILKDAGILMRIPLNLKKKTHTHIHTSHQQLHEELDKTLILKYKYCRQALDTSKDMDFTQQSRSTELRSLGQWRAFNLHRLGTQ